MQHRITVDLGPLHERLQSHCEATGQRPSEVVREALAKMLRVKPPRMDGNVANLKQYKKSPPVSKKSTPHSGGSTTAESPEK